MRRIRNYRTRDGKEPFEDWVQALPILTRAKIKAYVDLVAMGGATKNVKPVGGGVFEIKIDYGPGYRVYFGEDGKEIVLLLLGGDKRTQFKDIAQAKDFWKDYVSK